jgi:nucleotide-binding universal stress UspA family protein
MADVAFQRILLPIELGEPSSWEKALPVALDMARRHGAHLDVLTVIPDMGMPVVGSFFPADFEKKARAKAQEELTRWLEEHVPEDVDAEGHVSVGAIYHKIIRAAEKLNSDVIVMASHRPKMQDYLLGPNAARVVRHAPMHVFIVRS